MRSMTRSDVNHGKSVSMKDVARVAGVALGTVSNVLNNPELVSEATKARVQAAIDSLGWVRNESARQLRAGRSSAIGLVVLDVGNPFFADVARGAEDVVYERGMSMQIGNSDQRPDREARLIEDLEQQRVRGVLLAPVGDARRHVERLNQRGVAVVLVDRVGDDADCCSVAVDDAHGARVAINHLLDVGHRRIALVGGTTDLMQVRDRRAGAEAALTESGLPATLLVVSTPALDLANGIAAAAQLAVLPDGERPTAVFALNDLLAIGLLQGFMTAGLRVPKDIALIGYDDIAFAAAAAVPLSSVAQPRQALGARAADLLLAEIDDQENGNPHTHVHERFAPELVVRKSSAARRPKD